MNPSRLLNVLLALALVFAPLVSSVHVTIGHTVNDVTTSIGADPQHDHAAHAGVGHGHHDHSNAIGNVDEQAFCLLIDLHASAAGLTDCSGLGTAAAYPTSDYYRVSTTGHPHTPVLSASARGPPALT